MEYRWDIVPPPPAPTLQRLMQGLKFSRVAAILAHQRGIDDFEAARAFFRPGLNALHNPFLMADMQTAVDRITAALEESQTLLIYGDYDVDGTTAVALMVSFLRTHYPGTVHFYIPDRYTEGYGISEQGILYAADIGADLLIALDCGIRAHDKITLANEKGIDVIICDHHLPTDTLPPALAVLDPKRPDCFYPFKELSGCGIGFKLLHALCLHLNWPLDHLMPLLDLVAISTACDIVPVNGENRILLFHGLQQLNTKPRPGIKVMLELAHRQIPLNVSDVVFTIGPRINAAGRIKHGKGAVELLLAEDETTARSASELIEAQNTKRKEHDSDITREALQLIEDLELQERSSTVLYAPHWHKGVIGIVASRLIETYYRPTIVLTAADEGLAVGSARSVKGFDVHAAIDACSHHLVKFGGHMYAAGLTLERDKIDTFIHAFEAVVAERIAPEQLQPSWEINVEIDFSEITPKFYNIVQQMAPFGPANMEPLFLTRRVVDTGLSRAVGTDALHLKLDVFQEGDRRHSMGGIAFNLGHFADRLKCGNAIDIVYNLAENTWNGKTNIELMVRDIKISGNS
jgi:single-stranded-DNA-specific exonuclease